MPSCCSVPFCSERSGGHKFPRDKIIREKWIAAIRRVDFHPSKYSKVCKKHFKKDDYRLPKESSSKYPVHVLKKDAVPSKFSWNERKKTKRENNLEKKTLVGQRCSVLQCRSGSAKNIILHSCSNQEAVRKKWAEVFKVNREVVKNMLICSQHFLRTDYLNSKNGDSRILRQNAVPSQKLPRSTRIISMRKKVHHTKKTLMRPKVTKRVEKMTEVVHEKPDVDEKPDTIGKEDSHECRTCLKKMEKNSSTCSIFQSWVPPWNGMGATIAQDLAKLANVEVLESDNHSKVICEPCYSKLLDASIFIANVRVCDQLLQQRYTSEVASIDKVWPKPIQVDKNVNSNIYQDMGVEIKQEVTSDDEYNPVITENLEAPGIIEPQLGNTDIKLEPEEVADFVEPSPYGEETPFIEPPPLTITINGTMSLTTSNAEIKTLVNGTDDFEAIITDSTQNTELCNGNEYYDEPFLQTQVKEEPLSEEDDIELVPGLPLDCLLCTKSFNSVTGLKAHVIAQHSYKSVKRKLGDAESPQKMPKVEYRCQICRRAFVTSTDLMVHETCHNKHSCYVCTRKFDTFKQLSKHRKRCNLALNKTAVKPKTLDDVMRPLKEEKLVTSNISVKKEKEDYLSDNNMKLHLAIHSSKSETKTIKTVESENSDIGIGIVKKK